MKKERKRKKEKVKKRCVVVSGGFREMTKFSVLKCPHLNKQKMFDSVIEN